MGKDDADKKSRKKKELSPEHRTKRKKRLRIILLSVLALLILFRIFLPYIVLRYVNNKLANLEEYYGVVEDIDIHLYRGAYVIKNIEIVKKDKKTKDTIPFFKSPRIDLSVEWSALFDGAVVGEIFVSKPVLNFVKGAHKGEDVKQDTADFRQLIDDLMPIKVNRFDISDGEIHYIDQNTSPKIDISMKDINATATNLSNVNEENELLPATLVTTGQAYEGRFSLNVKMDALAKQPTFDLNTEMQNLNLVKLNDFLRAYGNFDVKKGIFNMYAEFAGKNGNFGGYVKPMLKDMDVVQWNKEEGNVPQILWESLVGLAKEVLENKRTDQVATKVPIHGTFEDPKVNLWKAISFILRNAFLHALKPSIDNSININKMKEDNPTLLEKLFSKDKKEGNIKDGAPDKSDRKKRRKQRREERKKDN